MGNKKKRDYYRGKKRNKKAKAARLYYQKKRALAAGLSIEEFTNQIARKENSIKKKTFPSTSRTDTEIILTRQVESEAQNSFFGNHTAISNEIVISTKNPSYIYCPQTHEIIQDICCRICLQDDIHQAHDLAGYTEKLIKCFPEMNFSIIPNAKICSKCCTALNVAYDFKILCQKTEEKLSSCIRVSSIPENIDSDKQLQLEHANARQAKQNEICSKSIKQEVSEMAVEVKGETLENEDCLSRYYFETDTDWAPYDVDGEPAKSRVNPPEYTFDTNVKEEFANIKIEFPT